MAVVVTAQWFKDPAQDRSDKHHSYDEMMFVIPLSPSQVLLSLSTRVQMCICPVPKVSRILAEFLNPT